MTGTELEIVTPAATEILGPEVDRRATLHTNARTDHELLAVWLKSHADGPPHTIRVYPRAWDRFLGALGAPGSNFAPGDRGERTGGAGGHAEQGGRLCSSPCHRQHVRRGGEVVPGLCSPRGLHPLQCGSAHQAQEGAAPDCTAHLERGRDCRAD